jgi:gluconate 5-dehydrogenase
MGRFVITGANQGIGFFMAGQLLKDGHHVAVLDIQTEGLTELKTQYSERLLPAVCDVSKSDEVLAAVNTAAQAMGGIDYACHNACVCTFCSMEETPDETYRRVFDVNYFGALNLARAVIPHMKAVHHGKVFFTSSGVGVMGFINISPYASSKGAVESLAKCLNIEYKDAGITFHIFHPPLTRTASSAPLPVPADFMADPQKVGAGLAKRFRKNRFIICHSFSQCMMTRIAYLFPLSMGRLMSKMTVQSAKEQ